MQIIMEKQYFRFLYNIIISEESYERRNENLRGFTIFSFQILIFSHIFMIHSKKTSKCKKFNVNKLVRYIKLF